MQEQLKKQAKERHEAELAELRRHDAEQEAAWKEHEKKRQQHEEERKAARWAAAEPRASSAHSLSMVAPHMRRPRPAHPPLHSWQGHRNGRAARQEVVDGRVGE